MTAARSFKLPRAVIALGLVSLFTDLSSEMIIPLLPVFLTTQLGASATFFGLVEGTAESVASLLKLFSGAWSDRMGRRFPLVLFGYSLSALMRPLMAFCSAPWQALVVRSADRVGKGLRSAPRDALLTAAVEQKSRGWAFGFHRAMDHTGAMLGALAAWALLAWGFQMNQVFFIAAIPGLFAVLAIIFGVKESKVPPQESAPSKASGFADFRELNPRLKRYLLVLGWFTLANSSDAFLLLKAAQVGIPLKLAPLLWLVLHITKALTNLAGGRLSDRIGSMPVIRYGWIVYGVVYALFGLADAAWQVWVLFIVYGLYHGLTEGAEKSWVAQLSDTGKHGSAFGWYHALTGAIALPASLWMGVVWQHYGSSAAFMVCAVISISAVGLLNWSARTPREAMSL
ncbi:MAG: MFS transporter [Verrucomicrobiaceae bacterium]